MSGLSLTDFVKWAEGLYDVAAGAEEWICRRCGEYVNHLTKHAVERHGDAIEVLPRENCDYEFRAKW